MTDPLPAARVRRRMDPEALGFDSTAELEPLEGLLGQERAERAMRFGASMPRKGFNLYVLGPPGMGKHRLVREVIEAQAERGDVPSDWVYVHRFGDADRPKALAVPPGRGRALEEAMEALVEDLADVVRAAFETEEFQNRRRVIEQRIEAQHEEAFGELADRADERGLRLLRTPGGLAFAPVKDGEVLEPKTFGQLPEAEQTEVKDALTEMEEALRDLMRQAPRWQREAREALRELERELASYAIRHQLEEVREAFSDLEEVTAWLDEVEADIVEHAPALVHEDTGEEAVKKALVGQNGPLRRYRVNLLVDRREQEGAPVVFEDHPTLERLVGRIEQRAQLGALVSDFTLIKAGALHRANGGALILDARRLLAQPSAWDSLKRALRHGEIEIESLGKTLGMSTGSLEPDPIPLSAKIVLVGDRQLYYALSALDPDFDQLFKVAADFEDEVPWDAAHVEDFARLVAGVAKGEELMPFDRGAVARLIEHAARLADHHEKLTTNLTRICDVMREADWHARERGAELAGAEDVRSAIEAQRQREGRIRERGLESFSDGTVLLTTSGEVVGQINGLSVMTLGHSRFGRPNRITCRVRIGKGEVVDIEREVQLGGPIHSKGVMILSSFLGAHYGMEHPLSLSASLVFEQSYGGVDGDSASLAELCALISALADAPIAQRFAITGSVNQMGQVQAIGGANEKVEGFFDVCRERGLDGGQGVILPAANVQHLMLREDVAAAVEEGSFSIYAVAHVDEALELLTGEPAGSRDEDGLYSRGTIHYRVAGRLRQFAESARAFLSRPGDGA
ncbi:MAG: ATP-binding protein [Myxococcota bacterium]|nr:ATP-binding protein [Myxococcota bacterium]